jgi:hypothetical protein
MTEDISDALGTVSNQDLPVISTEFMDIYLLLAHLHETGQNLATCYFKRPTKSKSLILQFSCLDVHLLQDINLSYIF